jgi:protein-S-isoprenylcysteine O-methyltransferase Ste14
VPQPFRFLSARPQTLTVAVFLLVSGAALAVAGVIEVVRHQTTIVPHHAVSVLVTTGAYRITRNPMHTGLASAYLGGALLVDSWWPLSTLPFALVAVGRVVIDPEERYLVNQFGQHYSHYRARVRRWL